MHENHARFAAAGGFRRRTKGGKGKLALGESSPKKHFDGKTDVGGDGYTIDRFF